LSLKDELYKRVRNSALLKFIGKKAKRFNPNTITLVGLAFAVLAGLLFAYGIIFCAVTLVIISGFFDLLDGAVAKANGRETELGEVLDSVSDRYADAIIITGIMLGYSLNLNTFWFLVGTSAVVGSILVSYVRAKGENAINEKITVGIADRPARIALIVIGAVSGFMSYAILAIAILSHFTVWQRMKLIKKKLKKEQ